MAGEQRESLDADRLCKSIGAALLSIDGVSDPTVDRQDAAPHYPLYCVDRTDCVDPETQYLGPFDTHDEAAEKAGPGDLVRRCRQLQATEIDYDACRMAAYDLTTFDALIEDVDEVATSGNLPETAWSPINKQIVFGRSANATLPHPDEFKAWADSNLEIFAYVCEGDE